MLQQAFNFNNGLYNTLFPKVIYPLAGFSMTGNQQNWLFYHCMYTTDLVIIHFFVTTKKVPPFIAITFICFHSFHLRLFVCCFWTLHIHLSRSNWQFLCDQESKVLHPGHLTHQCNSRRPKVLWTNTWYWRWRCISRLYLHRIAKKPTIHHRLHIVVQVDRDCCFAICLVGIFHP